MKTFQKNGFLVIAYFITCIGIQILSVFLSNAESQKPNRPSNLEAIAISSNEIELSWDKGDHENLTYTILQKSKEIRKYEPIKTNVKGTTYTVKGLSPNTNYLFKIQAKNGTYGSRYSNTARDKTFKDETISNNNNSNTSEPKSSTTNRSKNDSTLSGSQMYQGIATSYGPGIDETGSRDSAGYQDDSFVENAGGYSKSILNSYVDEIQAGKYDGLMALDERSLNRNKSGLTMAKNNNNKDGVPLKDEYKMGKFIEVKYNNTKKVFRIIDSLNPDDSSGTRHIDIYGKEAFKALTGKNPTEVKVEWRFVETPSGASSDIKWKW